MYTHKIAQGSFLAVCVCACAGSQFFSGRLRELVPTSTSHVFSLLSRRVWIIVRVSGKPCGFWWDLYSTCIIKQHSSFLLCPVYPVTAGRGVLLLLSTVTKLVTPVILLHTCPAGRKVKHTSRCLILVLLVFFWRKISPQGETDHPSLFLCLCKYVHST